MSKICKSCGNLFLKSNDYSNKSWAKAKYCSISCRHIGTKGQRIKKEIIDEAKKLILEGVSALEVSRLLPVSVNSLLNFCKDEIKTRRNIVLLRNKTMQRLYIEGATRIELAEIFNVNLGYVGFVCNGLREKDISGEKNPAWRGGITPLYKKIRTSNKYYEWRKKVFERDNYTCQLTGYRGNQLVVDHIKPFALVIYDNNIFSYEEAMACDELWDINNGRTLNRTVHYGTDTYGTKTYNMLRNAKISTRQPNNKKI